MGKYSGYIVSIEPSIKIVGDALAVRVTYHMETTSWWEKVGGWASHVEISSSDLGTQENTSPKHYGADYDGVAIFNFGAMPALDELFLVELQGWDARFSFYSEVVDVRTHYVEAENGITPPPPPPGDGGAGLPRWLLPVGIGLAAVVLLMPSGKGKKK